MPEQLTIEDIVHGAPARDVFFIFKR